MYFYEIGTNLQKQQEFPEIKCNGKQVRDTKNKYFHVRKYLHGTVFIKYHIFL